LIVASREPLSRIIKNRSKQIFFWVLKSEMTLHRCGNARLARKSSKSYF
jgi:hypothetical protein